MFDLTKKFKANKKAARKIFQQVKKNISLQIGR